MKLVLKEYNVVPKNEDKNEISIIMDEQILYNNQVVQGDNKLENITKLISEYKEEIAILNNERIESYKGGRQKSIVILFDDDATKYTIIGNTPLTEMANLYNVIKEKILSIIKDNN